MRSPQYSVPTTLALVISSLLAPNAFAEESEQDTETMIVRSTAEEALKQQPGVSIITAEDIAKQPPVNDLSDIIRKMPGVNLTGNSASGSRGNNRQIDIRGMGPENTLILIDGVPVTSRNAVRYSWRGERDTRSSPRSGSRALWFRRGGRSGQYHYQTSDQHLARFAVFLHQPAGKQQRRHDQSR